MGEAEMGFLKGSVTCTRFQVPADLPEGFRETVRERISRYAFRKLEEDSDQERTLGWVNIADELQVGFSGDEMFKEPYLALAARLDVRTVPARALRQYCREAEEEVKTLEGLDFLNKKRREEIRERVRKQLMRRVLPRTSTYDMAWDLQSGVVLFGSTTSRTCDAFSELFFNTFELRLTSLYPYALAYSMLQDRGMDPAALDEVQPAVLAGEGGMS